MDAADHELAAMLPRVSAAIAACGGAVDDRRPMELEAVELLERFRTGELSPVGVLEECVAGLQASAAGPLGAIWAVDTGDAPRAAAAESAARWRAGAARPLEGVPIVVKDLLDTAGLRTTGGSAWLADRVPDTDAAVVAALRAAGAIVVAKTATYELGCGNDEMAFGRAHNPWDPGCTTGGSSAGSAAALAARLAPLALGTDTGGSIRIPSSYCGVVGLKPTLGRLSCAGLLGLAPTLDTAGPMARTATDVGLQFAVLAGVPAPPPPLASLRRMRIGVARRWFCDVLDPPVGEAFEAALSVLGELGADVVEIDIPHAEHGAPLSWLITMAEAAQTYADAPREQLTAAFRGRLEVGERIATEVYTDALAARHRLRATVTASLSGCDVVVVPSTVCPAPRYGDLDRPVARTPATWPDVTARTMALWNVTGLPSITVPIGFTTDPAPLPLGMQIAGRGNADETLIAVAAAYQAATTHHLLPPRSAAAVP